MCLSNLKQQGNGFGTYGADHKGYLPRSGSQFRYTIMEGASGQGGNWVGAGAGALYGKYIGISTNIIYCPSNQQVAAKSPSNTEGLTNEELFKHNYLHSKMGDPLYNNSHDTGFHVAGNYVYGLPAYPGKCPRDKGKDMYGLETVSSPDSKTVGKINYSNYYTYVLDPADQSSSDAASFLGAFPPGSRGKYNTRVLTSDAYFGGFKVWHIDKINVLFSDFHARRVNDPKKKIVNGAGNDRYNTGDIGRGGGRAFIVWDYLSQRP